MKAAVRKSPSVKGREDKTKKESPRPAVARKKSPPKKSGSKKGATRKAGGRHPIWDWKTPDESWKLRVAMALVALLLLAVTCWSGEVERRGDTWQAGFRDLRGHWVLGLQWRWGEWPRRWKAD